MLNHLLVIHKHNLGIMAHDQMFQTLTFYTKSRHVGFGNKQQEVLHKILLLCIVIFIKITILKMICDGPITNDKKNLDFCFM
jgi:hypothetical protein